MKLPLEGYVSEQILDSSLCFQLMTKELFVELHPSYLDILKTWADTLS